mgnify:CR=1 FL=1
MGFPLLLPRGGPPVHPVHQMGAPFLILMVLVMPLSRVILGTTIGTPGILVPLTVAAFPFAARLGGEGR